MIIVKQLAAMQIILPLFGGLFSIVSFNHKFSRIIAIISIFFTCIFSIYGLKNIQVLTPYVFGDWQAAVGIEHCLSSINQPIIVFINILLLFILIFYRNQIDKSILQHISNSRKHLFYSSLLFAHTGYVGALSTNDLFNLYVFIEIFSISSYVLLCQGEHRNALIGGFNYLVIGTISATFILIGIGFLFSITGDLNMSYVAASYLQSNAHINLKLASISFISVGCLLKIAPFPIHLWLIDVYKSVPAIILCYLGSISALVGTYIFLRLNYPYYANSSQLWYIVIISSATIAIVFCAFLACRADNFKTLIGYSGASQIGIAFIMLSYNETSLALKYLIVDALGKLALFSLAAYYEYEDKNLNFTALKALPDNILLRVTAGLLLVCNAGLPLSGMFMLKLSALELALQNYSYIIFAALIANNLLTLQYHYKIFKTLFFGPKNQANSAPLTAPLLLILIAQGSILVFFDSDLWPGLRASICGL